MKEIEEYQKFAVEKMNWVKKKFPMTISENLHDTDLQRRTQEIWRDCLVLLRKSNLALKTNEDSDKEVLEGLYHTLKFKTIPDFVSWLEFKNIKK